MQVNLHGSPCIPGVFLYCFGYKKAKFSTKSARKYAILSLKYQKKIMERGTSPTFLAPLAPRLGSRFRRSRPWRLAPQFQLLDRLVAGRFCSCASSDTAVAPLAASASLRAMPHLRQLRQARIPAVARAGPTAPPTSEALP